MVVLITDDFSPINRTRPNQGMIYEDLWSVTFLIDFSIVPSPFFCLRIVWFNTQRSTLIQTSRRQQLIWPSFLLPILPIPEWFSTTNRANRRRYLKTVQFITSPSSVLRYSGRYFWFRTMPVKHNCNGTINTFRHPKTCSWSLCNPLSTLQTAETLSETLKLQHSYQISTSDSLTDRTSLEQIITRKQPIKSLFGPHQSFI